MRKIHLRWIRISLPYSSRFNQLEWYWSQYSIYIFKVIHILLYDYKRRQHYNYKLVVIMLTRIYLDSINNCVRLGLACIFFHELISFFDRIIGLRLQKLRLFNNLNYYTHQIASIVWVQLTIRKKYLNETQIFNI